MPAIITWLLLYIGFQWHHRERVASLPLGSGKRPASPLSLLCYFSTQEGVEHLFSPGLSWSLDSPQSSLILRGLAEFVTKRSWKSCFPNQHSLTSCQGCLHIMHKQGWVWTSYLSITCLLGRAEAIVEWLWSKSFLFCYATSFLVLQQAFVMAVFILGLHWWVFLGWWLFQLLIWDVKKKKYPKNPQRTNQCIHHSLCPEVPRQSAFFSPLFRDCLVLYTNVQGF